MCATPVCSLSPSSKVLRLSVALVAVPSKACTNGLRLRLEPMGRAQGHCSTVTLKGSAQGPCLRAAFNGRPCTCNSSTHTLDSDRYVSTLHRWLWPLTLAVDSCACYHMHAVLQPSAGTVHNPQIMAASASACEPPPSLRGMPTWSGRQQLGILLCGRLGTVVVVAAWGARGLRPAPCAR